MTLMATNRSHDLILLPSSFQLNCPHHVDNFVTNNSIPVLKLFIIQSIGYLCPIFFIKLTKQEEQNCLQNWESLGSFCKLVNVNYCAMLYQM